jgi:hypothetical protein
MPAADSGGQQPRTLGIHPHPDGIAGRKAGFARIVGAVDDQDGVADLDGLADEFAEKLAFGDPAVHPLVGRVGSMAGGGERQGVRPQRDFRRAAGGGRVGLWQRDAAQRRRLEYRAAGRAPAPG